MALNAQEFLSAPTERVTALLSSEEFIRRVSEASGGTLDSYALSGDPTGTFSLDIRRSFPTQGLPDLVQRFAGAQLSIHQQEDWSAPDAAGARDVSVTAKVSGAPVEITAQQRLDPEAGASPEHPGTLITLQATVSSQVPFLGEKIASAAEPALIQALHLQLSEAQKTLESHA